MIVNVKVVTNAKRNLIKKENNILKVYVTQPAIQGKANKVLIELMSEYFKVKKNQITILKGKYSSLKLVEII